MKRTGKEEADYRDLSEIVNKWTTGYFENQSIIFN
jgi:hypothetical protein